MGRMLRSHKHEPAMPRHRNTFDTQAALMLSGCTFCSGKHSGCDGADRWP